MRGRRYPGVGRRMRAVPKHDRARRRAGYYGVHHEYVINTTPALNQFRSFPATDLNINPQFQQAFRDQHPGSIITAVSVATADDQHVSVPTCSSSRSTTTFKK